MSHNNVSFDDWKTLFIKCNYIFRGVKHTGWNCKLCNKNFKQRSDHKKTWLHIKNFNEFEDARYEYVLDQKKKERETIYDSGII